MDDKEKALREKMRGDGWKESDIDTAMRFFNAPHDSDAPLTPLQKRM